MPSNWNLEMSIFGDRGNPENPEKNLSEQSKEPTTNLTYDHESGIEPTQQWEASAIPQSPPCSPFFASLTPRYLLHHAKHLIQPEELICSRDLQSA